jgi:hypothetical protein
VGGGDVGDAGGTAGDGGEDDGEEGPEKERGRGVEEERVRGRLEKVGEDLSSGGISETLVDGRRMERRRTRANKLTMETGKRRSCFKPSWPCHFLWAATLTVMMYPTCTRIRSDSKACRERLGQRKWRSSLEKACVPI